MILTQYQINNNLKIINIATNLMEMVEDIRCSIFDKTEELFEYTGSCSLKKPSLENSLIGMLWKISCDTKVIKLGLILRGISS